MNTLPIHDVIETLRQTLLKQNRLILQAPPGAGKTTAVPLSLLNEPWLEGKQIIMLEPRRLAARASASRMAQLLGESVGMRVGYQIRSEKKMSDQTQILVVTEGILTRRLQSDPTLENVALIIFDEFHERHLHSDLSLAFALQTQECLRDDLKIMVMSATLDTRGLSTLLESAPIITSEGKSYSVALTHLKPNATPIDPNNIVPPLFTLTREVLEKESGDILIFLPGVREIKALELLLKNYAKERSSDLLIAPLYGDLSKADQERAITPATMQKVILATNIAETSLTIEGVRIVIDSGLERVVKFDASSGMERLVTQKISRASATQRAGRAGRVCEGSCYRLWSEIAHHSLAPHSEPEILQCDLTPLALELAAWGSSSDELRWIDTPSSHALEQAYTLLEGLDALHSPKRITAHGTSLLTLGLHPRLAHMIMAAKHQRHQSEAILLATLLSERDPFAGLQEKSADIRERFWLLKSHLQNRPIPSHLYDRLDQLRISVRELAQRLRISISFDTECSDETIAILLAMAYPDRLARIRQTSTNRYLTATGKEAMLDSRDDLCGCEWLIIVRSDGDTKTSRIHLCAPITDEAVHNYFSHWISTQQSLTWNEQTQRVESRETTQLGAILLESRSIESQEKDKVAKKLCEGIRLSGLESLPWSDKGRSFLYRLRCLYHHEKLSNPYSDTQLLETLESWLLPHLTTHSSLRDVQTLDLYTILSSALDWESLKRLDLLFPEYYLAPTGNQLSIDYSDPDSPVLAVRIQELFGLKAHPSVHMGKLSLLVHLLSPAHRPIQMTRDLVGFWSGSYHEVKKELKGRYPKHYWPDDPHNAQATSRTKKFMNT